MDSLPAELPEKPSLYYCACALFTGTVHICVCTYVYVHICVFLHVITAWLLIILYFYFKNKRVCAQSFLTFCDPLDCSLPGSSLHGIFQARNTGVCCYFLLQGSSQPRNQIHMSCASCISSRFLPTEPLGKSQRNLEAHKISFIWELEMTIYHTAIVKITWEHTSKTKFYNIWHSVNVKWMFS